MRLRRRAGGDPGREGAARPAGAGRPRDGLRRAVSRTGRSRTRTCRRSRASSTRPASCSRSSALTSCRSTRRSCTATSRASSSPWSRSIRGTRVRFTTPNAGWDVGRDEPFEPRNPELDTGHALAGPIEVRGARAGQVLAVRIDEVVPGRGASRSAAPDHRLDWELEGDVGRAAGRSVRLAPFLGVLGMPPDEPGVHSTTPPRRCGGNIDCKELVAGTTLYLPIPVDGALLLCRRRPRRPGRRRGVGHGDRGAGRGGGDAGRARRPRARVADRPDRRRLADLRLRRAPRRRCPDRGRRDARPDGARARALAAAMRSRSPRSSSTSASPRSSTRCSACTRSCATTRCCDRAAAALARARPGRLPPPRRRDR